MTPGGLNEDDEPGRAPARRVITPLAEGDRSSQRLHPLVLPWQFVEVTARFHPFVQHANDLDHTFLGDAIVENVNRSPDPCVFFSRTACISDVEAADT